MNSENINKEAILFYEFWYDKYRNSEIDKAEKAAVIHGFINGYNMISNKIDKILINWKECYDNALIDSESDEFKNQIGDRAQFATGVAQILKNHIELLEKLMPSH